MKSTRFTLLLSMLSIVLFNACKKESTPTPVSLLTNGDIEQQSQGQGWFFGYSPTTSNVNNYTASVSTEAASSPQNSLKLICTQVKSDTAFGYFGQNNIPISSISVGNKLTLKAKIKTALVGPGVSIAIRGDKGNTYGVFFVTTQGKTPITGTQDFTEYSVVLDSFPGGIDNLLIYLVYLPKTTGTVYFDDVSLTVN